MKFKVIDWLRRVRDENCERNKDVPAKEKMDRTTQAAQTFVKSRRGVDSTTCDKT